MPPRDLRSVAEQPAGNKVTSLELYAVLADSICLLTLGSGALGLQALSSSLAVAACYSRIAPARHAALSLYG